MEVMRPGSSERSPSAFKRRKHRTTGPNRSAPSRQPVGGGMTPTSVVRPRSANAGAGFSRSGRPAQWLFVVVRGRRKIPLSEPKVEGEKRICDEERVIDVGERGIA